LISRRLFLGGLAGVCAPQPLVLEAIAAERMPHRLLVSGVPRSPFFELRDYETPCSELLVALGHAQRLGNGKLLFPFDSLAQREQLWRRINADPQWIAVRNNAVVNEIAVYRTL
jgi:hypothetical protein